VNPGCVAVHKEFSGDEAQLNKLRRKELPMRDFLTKLYVKAQLFREHNGQDLIEYSLIAALIALAAAVGMNTIATDINSAFTTIGGQITTYS
jgi:pilus assembly protein Flp/PilA